MCRGRFRGLSRVGWARRTGEPGWPDFNQPAESLSGRVGSRGMIRELVGRVLSGVIRESVSLGLSGVIRESVGHGLLA